MSAFFDLALNLFENIITIIPKNLFLILYKNNYKLLNFN